MPRFAKFIVLALIAFGVACSSRAQTAGQIAGQDKIQSAIGLRVGNSEVVGSISVYVRNEQGESLPVTAQITVSFARSGNMPRFLYRRLGTSYVFAPVPAGDDYQVDVEAKGYQTAHQMTSLANIGNANSDVIVFMKPVDDRLEFHPPEGQFILAPKAQKEIEKGLDNLRSGRDEAAQKHLQKALVMAPENPYANYVMGLSYLLAKRQSDARPYLEKSVSLDAKQPAALFALGTLRFESDDYAGAIQTLSQDVDLDSSSWKAEWTLAAAYLKEQNFAQARQHAERSLEVGKRQAISAELLLGEALAGLGARPEAVQALQTYLNAYPNDANADQIKDFIVALKKIHTVVTTPAGSNVQGSSTIAPSASLGLAAPEVELPPKENWAPVDIDTEKPLVISGPSCPLTEVLDKVGRNTVGLVSDLQQFTAVEQYQAVEVKRDERLETPVTRTFNYLVAIETPSPRLVEVKEIRDNNLGPADLPGRLSDNGAPGLVLAFHPVYRDDFTWQCEGLGEWKDQPVWVIHFVQRADRPTSLLASFDTPAQEFALPLKGRAWVSTQSGQVVRLESDLVRPLEPANLMREHFTIEYQPVEFKAHKVTLWLPQSADVYIQYQGHYLHHQHSFSNFKLFWVGTSQKIEAPKQSAKPGPNS